MILFGTGASGTNCEAVLVPRYKYSEDSYSQGRASVPAILQFSGPGHPIFNGFISTFSRRCKPGSGYRHDLGPRMETSVRIPSLSLPAQVSSLSFNAAVGGWASPRSTPRSYHGPPLPIPAFQSTSVFCSPHQTVVRSPTIAHSCSEVWFSPCNSGRHICFTTSCCPKFYAALEREYYAPKPNHTSWLLICGSLRFYGTLSEYFPSWWRCRKRLPPPSGGRLGMTRKELPSVFSRRTSGASREGLSKQ